MSGTKSNIVPITDSARTQLEGGEVPDELISGEISDRYSSNLARDAIDFMNEEFKADVNEKFWQVILEYASAKVGQSETAPPKENSKVVPFTPDQKKAFLQREVPWGQYVGMKVATVLRKDKAALEKMAANPLRFQIELRRFFESAEPS